MANGIVPNTQQEAISFFQARLPLWAVSPTSIGLTSAIVTDLASMVSSAQTSLNAATAARAASKNATVTLAHDLDAMRSLGGDAIKTIRAFAETTANPDVYTIASIPPPAVPTPAGPPEQPYNLGVSLNPTTGSLHLTWKGSSAQNAYFAILRRVGSEGPFVLLDTTTAKAFEDVTVPDGATTIEYFIQARRDEFRVDSIGLTVRFGTGGMSVTSGTPISLAA
jgi:hypothetical protein